MKKRGVSLVRTNLIYSVFVCSLCVLAVISTSQLYRTIQQNALIHADYENAVDVSMQLQKGSDFLTDEARLFVTNQDFIHIKNYCNELFIFKSRESALAQLSAHQVSAPVLDDFLQAMQISNDLLSNELYAAKLIIDINGYNPDSLNTEAAKIINDIKIKPEDEMLSDAGKLNAAREIMFSSSYTEQKSKIALSTYYATQEILDQIFLRRTINLKRIRFFTILTICIVIFIFIVTFFFLSFNNYFVVTPIRNIISNISNDEKFREKGSVEFRIMAKTYNSMYDKHKTDEILLRQKAEHDELTGILNRSAFAQLTNALTNQKQNLVMLFVDVDFFKQINDNYGHATGDKVLKHVAQLLSENFRSIDFVSRIGGDEFAIIATDTDVKSKSIIARKLESIQEELANPTEKSLPKVSLSIGVAFSTNGYSQALYNKADAALYKVKENGRNGYKIDMNPVN